MPDLLLSLLALYGGRAEPDARVRSGWPRRCASWFAAAVLSISGLTALAQPIFPEPATRADAVLLLEDAEPRQRAAAVAFLARTGLATDGPLLAKRLFDDNPLIRELAEQALWQVWGRSGDAQADRLLAAGMAQMSGGRLKEAIATFTRAIRRKPDFAEGWNKRATAYYLAGNYPKSLADCAEVMKRNPQHFGALSGYGQIYFQLEEYDKALEYFRRALAVNPNMAGVELNIRAIEDLLRERLRRTI
jgi:tetratricopeptide (TPR) repeat protein